MLLFGKPVAEELFQETHARVQEMCSEDDYILFFLLSDDTPSQVYVKKKCAYATKLGLRTQVIDDIRLSKQQVILSIQQANNDKQCRGIVVQLPLAPHLKSHQSEILGSLAPAKDIDGLGGVVLGLSLMGLIDFLPATPKAVMRILAYYGYGDLRAKTITLIGQSNLIGKPLAAICMDRGATVLSFNTSSNKKIIQQAARESDIIISATGVTHLITTNFFGVKDPGDLTQLLNGKVIIDVGWGIEDGKAIGDTDREDLLNYDVSITPVPGGVGPVTVACLFHNLVDLATVGSALKSC